MRGLVLDGLVVRRGGAALVAIDARIGPGEVLTLMGASGVGKSTLIGAVAGFLPPGVSLDGRVRVDGDDVTALAPAKRRLGLLFQDPLLFPHFSVLGNLLYALPPDGGRAARREAAEALLAAVGLQGLGARDPETLSGGQKARVALMRVLAAAPRALLLDEPFSRLDADLRRAVRETVFGEARARGLPVLLVTHDAEDAAAAGGRVVAL